MTDATDAAVDLATDFGGRRFGMVTSDINEINGPSVIRRRDRAGANWGGRNTTPAMTDSNAAESRKEG